MRIPSVAAAAVIMAVLLGGCTASPNTQAPSATDAPSPVEGAEAESTRSNIALTCSVISTVQTSVGNAATWRNSGQLDDAGYAAVVNTVPAALNGLLRNPRAGLQSEIRAAREAITASPPTIPGAQFDPKATEFDTVMHTIATACEANDTKIIIYGVPGDG